MDLIIIIHSFFSNIFHGDVSESDHFKTSVMPFLLPLSSQKHTLTTDLSVALWSLLPAQLKAVITKPRNSDISDLSPVSLYNIYNSVYNFIYFNIFISVTF